MVTVVGGSFGVDYSVSLNAPGSAGMTLLNQSVSAILYTGLEAASFVGAVIKPLKGASVVMSKSEGVYWGQVSVIDSIIEYSESDPSCVAFDTVHSLYLSNVYISNCAFVTKGIPANAFGWALVSEVAVAVDIPTPSRSCVTATMPVYVNGAVLPVHLANVSISGEFQSVSLSMCLSQLEQVSRPHRCKLWSSISGPKTSTRRSTWRECSTSSTTAPKVI
jgi:hypothetical protein